jgi:hypothetical protein
VDDKALGIIIDDHGTTLTYYVKASIKNMVNLVKEQS